MSNDKLREALEVLADFKNHDGDEFCSRPTDERILKAAAFAREALAASKQEPQAQAGEPDDYKAWYEDAMCVSNEAGYVGYDAAATIRAMSETIAKKDAALDACSLPESYAGGTCLSYPGRRAEVTLHFSSIEDAERWFDAITQAKEAMR